MRFQYGGWFLSSSCRKSISIYVYVLFGFYSALPVLGCFFFQSQSQIIFRHLLYVGLYQILNYINYQFLIFVHHKIVFNCLNIFMFEAAKVDLVEEFRVSSNNVLFLIHLFNNPSWTRCKWGCYTHITDVMIHH